MEEDIQNYLTTVMFLGTPCIISRRKNKDDIYSIYFQTQNTK